MCCSLLLSSFVVRDCSSTAANNDQDAGQTITIKSRKSTRSEQAQVEDQQERSSDRIIRNVTVDHGARGVDQSDATLPPQASAARVLEPVADACLQITSAFSGFRNLQDSTTHDPIPQKDGVRSNCC
jgi:hypothetical protein